MYASTYDLIGGNLGADGNVISGNGKNGIHIVGGTTNRVTGNFIGTDKTGKQRLGNALNGILLDNGAIDDTIGGLLNANLSLGGTQGNLISGNGTANQAGADQGNGIEIFSGSSNSTSNDITGNFIGTDISGMSPLGNTRDGIYLTAGSDSTTIGWTQARAGNLISANGSVVNGVKQGYGIEENSNNNLIDYDIVGLNINGADPNGNMTNLLFWLGGSGTGTYGTHNRHN